MLDSILTFGEDELVEGLKAFIEAIVNENVSLVISRQLLSEVRSLCFCLPQKNLVGYRIHENLKFGIVLL